MSLTGVLGIFVLLLLLVIFFPIQDVGSCVGWDDMNKTTDAITARPALNSLLMAGDTLDCNPEIDVCKFGCCG